MKKRAKILIAIVALIILIVAIVVIINFNKKHKIEEYVNQQYNYFAMYSQNGKVGVVDKKGKLLIEAKYTDVFIPNPSKDIFVCYENSDSFKFLNSKGEELYKNYDDVDILQTSDLNLEFDKNFLKFKK